ncbi:MULTISPECIES: ATP-binding protein [Prauserella salsuginis group]|uniref:histidine kinase n=2 Tax=Prauserella salsuginis group TaxID=2893672 RepID=A0A839XSH5_9PSEU|nr:MULTISPECIES: sensor histidine kinase [Prauserella salsuginis group]MBB3665681.1 two-component system CitB family sensor kinase [Prauserella sediminis]MCR3722873.1 two-component system, CitB family, sensor kinase [Prauserella flava]MCR3737452.1 two-component system, CitB family, sensor kinase [Prauserella salsuginis]
MTARRIRCGRPRLSLTGYLFLSITILLLGALLAAGTLWTVNQYREVRDEYTERALTLAQSVAELPSVRDYLADPRHRGDIAPLAERIRRAAEVRYVVIVDADGIRHSHPDPAQIGGRPHTDPAHVLAGNTWTGTEWGPAGLTLRTRVPVESRAGDVVGYVSVGVLSSRVSLAATSTLPTIGAGLLLALVVGAGGAWLISRRIRAKTHGLEPREITELLESREALLYAISEGVLAADSDGAVLLANDSARTMLDLPDDCVGRSPADLGLHPRLRAMLAGTEDTTGELFLPVGDRLLVCEHRAVRIGDQGTGRLVTLRDHTELVRLGGELDGVRTMVGGLRAQTHEFANRIHTVSGMLDLGAVPEARQYLAELSATTTEASTRVSEHVADTALAALVLAKSAQAAEQGVDFELAALSDVPADLPQRLRDDALLVVGNLVDNALDAVGSAGWVELLVRLHDDDHRLLEVRVTDSGPGIDPALGDDVFTAGVSTKDRTPGGYAPRGLGLALVRQACTRWGGWVDVDSAEETVFSAFLPVREDAR